MAGVVSMIAELDDPIPKNFVGDSSTKQSQRVCHDAVDFMSDPNISKRDAQERQELYDSGLALIRWSLNHARENRGSEKLDAEDDLTEHFIRAYGYLLTDDGVAAADGADKQDHGAGIVSKETSVKSDSDKEGQHNDEEFEKASLKSDSEKEGQHSNMESEDSSKILVGDVKSDPSSSGIKLEKFDTNDADPEEECSDDELETDWAFGGCCDEGFHGTGFWKLFDREVDEEMARIARARDMATEPTPDSDLDLLYGLPRDYIENLWKNPPPPLKWDFGDEFFPSVEEEEIPHQWYL